MVVCVKKLRGGPENEGFWRLRRHRDEKKNRCAQRRERRKSQKGQSKLVGRISLGLGRNVEGPRGEARMGREKPDRRISSSGKMGE